MSSLWHRIQALAGVVAALAPSVLHALPPGTAANAVTVAGVVLALFASPEKIRGKAAP